MPNTTWVNNDGLLIRYGVNQGKRNARAGNTQSNSKENELVLEVDLTGPARTIYGADLNNDGTLDGFTALSTPLPANCIVTEQKVIVLTTLAGGTNYAVGTYLQNGTVDDADGIRTTAGADGVQVNVQLTAARQVAVVTTGTYTAGKIKVIIRYVTV